MLASNKAVCVSENKNEKPLPKTLPGAVCAQMVRCGKPTCKCARGELHGPYFYRFVWQRGRLRKVYVRRDEVEQTRQACETNRAEARKRRMQRKLDRQNLRSLLASLTDLRALIAQMPGE